MIRVSEAKSIIQKHTDRLSPVCLSLSRASGLTIAADIFAPTDIPAFAQSSMDGFAFRYDQKNSSYRITGEMPAGTLHPFSIADGEAVRIFTGAPLPAGADTVVMQEKTEIISNQLINKDQSLTRGANVRTRGAEIREGELAVRSGTTISAAVAGFLAAIGIDSVSVYPPPAVSVIVTGNELQAPGQPLLFGQVYESNGIMLELALRHAGVASVRTKRERDNLDALTSVVEEELQYSDIILLTGGVSVGDYDFVRDTLLRCQVDIKFHGVKQKPGKPLLFGVRENKLVFGLPGNPSSALTCFYVYVLPAIRTMLNKSSTEQAMTGTLASSYKKPAAMTHFLKAALTGDQLRILHAQESFRLHSFALANCLAVLEDGKEQFAEGDRVDVLPLPV